jgi:uncharacterized integral membrane protein (TIGR00697 family)
MDTFFIIPLIEKLQGLSAESVSVILLGICALAILVLFRFLGANGLHLYNIVAVIAANIQVLKGAQFSFSQEPVALGTVVFATTYLCSDILTEHFGKEVAMRGVWYSFAAQILMTLLMVIAVGYPPLAQDAVGAAGTEHMPLTAHAIALLFTPSPRLLFASLWAFAISQYGGIWIFQKLQKLTGQRRLWLRTSVSTFTSAILDTILFSVLAWQLLAPHPVTFHVLIFTYILGTLITRAFVSILSTPVMYLTYFFLPLRPLHVS